MKNMPTLYLVDGSNNLYRSYYAIRGLTNSAGFSTNAVYGFTQMLRKLLKEQKPDAIAVTFDLAGGAASRKEQYADYKKDRKPMPDDLVPQVPLVREVVEAFGIPIIARSDVEADDLIGSLACRARDAGYDVVVATSDKDFFQLVGPGIRLWHTTREVMYGPEDVLEQFGVRPEQVVDVMAIWGDAIDNIPGVPGIGEKGAKSLIAEYGTLENLLAQVDQVPKKGHREKLTEHADQARLSRTLATIRCDLDVEVDPTRLQMSNPDRGRLHELFARLEFHSLMQEYLPAEPEEAPASYLLETDPQRVSEWLAGNQRIAIHAEPRSIGHPELAVLALSAEPGNAIVVPLNEAELVAVVRSALQDGREVISHDMKAQLRRLGDAGLPQPAIFQDPMLESYALNPGAYSHAFESLVRERLRHDVTLRKELDKVSALLDADERGVAFAGEKSDYSLRLHQILEPELQKDAALQGIYERIELPLVPVLARMEGKGIRIDVPLLEQMSQTMGLQIETLEQEIYREAGQEFNINSPSQLGFILFEKLQYPVMKKTQKTKSSSTGVEVLRELAAMGHRVPQLIMEHRELHKLKSTYVDALPQLAAPDGRVRSTFNQAVASTGRLSSSDPNLQNIPIRTAQGREIRKAFVAEPGYVLLSADYSQIELRVLAHVTGDEGLIDAFRRNADIHRATAARIFNVHEDLVTPDQRRASKTINFGVLYGMSAFRLSNELGISTHEAKSFIEAYFGRYPRIREYLDATLAECRASGKVTTLFGRVRHIPEIHNRSFTIRGNAERMATNAPIQGTAADLMKMAMINLDRRLREECASASMLLTVHDEIVIEIPESEVERLAPIVRETMESVQSLAVPLAVDLHWGPSWYDAKS